jgi:hypothetical protein
MGIAMKKINLLLFLVTLSLFGNSYQISHLNYGTDISYSISESGYSINFSNSLFVVKESENRKLALSRPTYNTAPEINIVDSISVAEDTTTYIPFSYLDRDGDDINITVAKNGDKGDFQQSSRNIFTYTPYSNEFGSDLVSLQFSDGYGFIEKNISIEILSQNSEGILGDMADLSVYEDSGAIRVSLPLTDSNSTLSILTSSTNSDLATISVSANSLEITPKAEQSGSSTISVTVSNGEKTTVKSFLYTVLPLDDKPVFEALVDLEVDEDSEERSVELTIFDIDSNISDINYSVTASNPELINITLSDSTLQISPKENLSGSSTVTVTATVNGERIEESFQYTVSPIDDLPLLAPILDLEVEEDSEEKTVNLSLSDIDSDVANALFSVTSSNPTLAYISVYGSSLQISPKKDQFGTATVTVTAIVDREQVSQTFLYSVVSVDDSPTIPEFEDISQDGNGESVTIPISFSDLDSNLEDAKITVTSSSPDIADVSISGSSLKIVPKDGISGETEITVTVALDTQIVSQTFSYSIESDETAPQIGEIDDFELESFSETFTKVIDLEFSGNTNIETLSASSSNPDLVSVSADLESSKVTLQVSGNSTGKADITLVAKSSNGESGEEKFLVTVSSSQSQICVAELQDTLSFEDISGENSSQNYIEYSLDLISEIESCSETVSVSWKISDELVVSADGTVSRDEESDRVIELTASLSSSGFEGDKSFLITVPRLNISDEVAVEDAIAGVTFESIKNENLKRSEIYTDLNLYESGNYGTTLFWSSSDPSISQFGKISRGGEDKSVTLSVKISKGSESRDKNFSLVVKGEKTLDSDIVTADGEWLTLSRVLGENSDKDFVTRDIQLYELGANGSYISWESSDENIISLEGEVNRDVVDRYIQLTATLESGESSKTAEFLLKVPKLEVIKEESDLQFKRVEDVDSNESKVISVVLESESGEEFFTTLEVDKNISQNIETTLSEEGLKTVFEGDSSITTLSLKSDGTVSTKVENSSGESSNIDMKISGSSSSFGEDGSIVIKSETVEATLESNGSLSYSSGLSYAKSSLSGSLIEATENGVETTYKSVTESENGEKFVVEATVKTDNNSGTETSFSFVNLDTGEVIEMDSTLSDGENFSENTDIEIGKNSDGDIEISISADISKSLTIR